MAGPKRLASGWELIVESPAGEQVGWYSGHGWSPGGRLVLYDGSEFALRWRVGRWTLRTALTKQPIMTMQAHVMARLTTTVIQLPEHAAEPPAVILTTWAVALLDRSMPRAVSSDGPPRPI